MVPATVQDQTDAINVRECDPPTWIPELSGEGDRVAPALLAIDADNSVFEHSVPAGPATTVHPLDLRAIRASPSCGRAFYRFPAPAGYDTLVSGRA